jgi:sugar phosphate isomerase/epimerase
MPAAAPRVAAWLDSYRLQLRSALQRASADGFHVIQAGAARELDPHDFSRSASRHLTRYLRDLGLSLNALAAEFPGLGLADPHLAEQRLDHLRRMLELGTQLRVPRVGTRICGLAGEASRPLAQEALQVVADLADRSGIVIAIQPAQDDPWLLAERLRALGCPNLGIALDSATWQPVPERAAALAELVGMVHLRDVRRVGDRIEEVAYGEGAVDFAALLGLLAEGGYAGALTVRRDAAAVGIDAMRQGRDYVEALLQGLTKR